MTIDILFLSQTDISCDSRILKSIQSAIKGGLETYSIGLKSKKDYVNKSLSCDTKNLKNVVSFTGNINFLPRLIKNFIVPIELCLKIAYLGIRKNPKIIHCNDVTPLPVSLIIKLFTNSKIIYDAHELESRKNGLHPLAGTIVFIFEKIFWHQIDYFITVSDSIMDWYLKRFGYKDASIIYNSPIYNSVRSFDNDYLRNKFKISASKNIFIYIGELCPSRGLRFIVNIFIKQNNNVLICLGDGPMKHEIIKITNENSNIFYHPPIPHNQVTSIASTADYGICLLANVSLSDYYALPNKLFEYIFSGLPIIASDFPDIEKVLRICNAGVSVSFDLESVKNGISKIVKNYKKSDFYEEAIKRYSWSVQEDKLISVYSKLKTMI